MHTVRLRTQGLLASQVDYSARLDVKLERDRFAFQGCRRKTWEVGMLIQGSMF